MVVQTEFHAKFQTKKIRSWRNSYKRIFGLTDDSVVTIDPNDFSVTNRFPYESITNISPSDTNPEDFSFDAAGGGALQFRCNFRAQLLTELLRLRARCMVQKGQPGGGGGGGSWLFEVQRLDRTSTRRRCVLRVMPHALVEVDPGIGGAPEAVLREYRLMRLEHVGICEGDHEALVLRICGRPKVFFCSQRTELIRCLHASAKLLGIQLPERAEGSVSLDSLVLERRMFGTDLGAPIVSYDVEKRSARHAYPVSRRLAVYTRVVSEFDASTASCISVRTLASVYALVRSPGDGRELRIEYDDGEARTYLTGKRDALAASLYDAARAVGNERIVVTSEVSDGLRLLPRNAVQEKSDRGFFAEAFFGPDTIEFFFLKRLSTVAEQCATLAAAGPSAGRAGQGSAAAPLVQSVPLLAAAGAALGASSASLGQAEGGADQASGADTADGNGRASPAAQEPSADGAATAIVPAGSARYLAASPDDFAWDDDELLLAASEFNANVPPRGIKPTTDKMYVRNSLQPICTLLDCLTRRAEDISDRTAHLVSALLQAVARIVPCHKGFKHFFDIPDVLGIFHRLLVIGRSRPTVAYWAVSILRSLIRCPFSPRNRDQEFQNKEAILSSLAMREALLDLLDSALSDLRFAKDPDEVDLDEDEEEEKRIAAMESAALDEKPPTPEELAAAAEAARAEAEAAAAEASGKAAANGEAPPQPQQPPQLSRQSQPPQALQTPQAPQALQPPGVAGTANGDAFVATSGAPDPAVAGAGPAAEASSSADVSPAENGAEVASDRRRPDEGTAGQAEAVPRKKGTDGGRFSSPQAAAAAKRAADRKRRREQREKEMQRERERDEELDCGDEDEDPAGTGDASNTNDLVLMALSDLLEAVLCSRADTTPSRRQHQMLKLLARRHEVLLCLLRTSCALTIENAALLLTALVSREPKIADVIAEAAMSEAVVLRHWYNGVFSPSADQRFISRYLVQIWMSGSQTGSAKRLLRRMIPQAFLTYLTMPKLSGPEERNLDELEEEYYRQSMQASSANALASSANTKRLRTRLRRTLDIATGRRTTPTAADSSPGDAGRLGAPDEARDSIGSATSSGGMSLAPPPPQLAPQPPAAVSTVTASAVHAEGAGPAPPTPKAAPGQPVPRPRFFMPTVKAEDVLRRLGQDNFRVLFFQLTQDQNLADLVWNARTRQELRTALEAELASFERQQLLRGVGRVAWNHEQFSIQYDSMAGELCVGGVYLRLFMESGDSFVASLPNPQRLFELLVRRMLVEAERNPALCNIAVRCLEKLYRVHHHTIGSFEDMDVVVAILSRARDRELQARTLQLLISLGKYDENAEFLLTEKATTVLVAASVMCHRNPPTIGNDLSRKTNLLRMSESSREEGSVVDYNCPNMWYIAPPGKIPPSPGSEQGPYRIPQLLELVQLGELHDYYLCAPAAVDGTYDESETAAEGVDTGWWRRLADSPTLRWIVLGEGEEIMRPAGFASLALRMLQRLAKLHRSVDHRRVPFHPIPRAKQLLCEPSLLGPLAQCLLCNDQDVVEIAAKVLTALTAHNPEICGRMYRTGMFPFALASTGHSFTSVAKLLHATHLRQHNRGVQDAARTPMAGVRGSQRLPAHQRSALSNLLPPAMVLTLHNYGPRRFAEVFCGEFETPEVIWSPSLRALLIDLIGQHLGDFPLRLRQHPLLLYDFCPCPKVVYSALEEELFCHNFYLRLLCDEQRFPEWPVEEPVSLLYAALELYREEMRESGPGGDDVSLERDGGKGGFAEALQILGLEPSFEETDLRKAYRTLARKYHPDRNPTGRDMFERVQAAYEILTSPKARKAMAQGARSDGGDILREGPDGERLRLLLHAQVLVYRRFPEEVKEYKFPVFRLVMKNLQDVLPAEEQCPPEEGNQLAICLRAVKLAYYCCLCSPHNAEELIREGGVPVLYAVMHAVLADCVEPKDDGGDQLVVPRRERTDGDATLPGSSVVAQRCDVLSTVLKTLAGLSFFEAGRAALEPLAEELACDLYIVAGLKRLPKCVQFGLECAAHCCTSGVLQRALCRSGLAWKCIPLMLRFDAGAEEHEIDASQGELETQMTTNAHARLAARVLGRMAGVMMNELASALCQPMRDAVDVLFTRPLAKLLRNKRADALLNALNRDVEEPTKIWNGQMREELLDRVREVVTGREPRQLDAAEDIMAEAQSFSFTCLRHELCIGGVYVRLFVANASTRDIEDSVEFGAELLRFIWDSLAKASAEGEEKETTPLLQALTALRELLLVDDHCILCIIDEEEGGIGVLVHLLGTLSLRSMHFRVTSAIFAHLAPKEEFSLALSQQQYLWGVLRALARARVEEEAEDEREAQDPRIEMVAGSGSTIGGEQHCWDVLEALCASTGVGREMLRVAGPEMLVLLLVGHPDFSSSIVARTGAVGAAARMLKNPAIGIEAFTRLAKLLPEGVVDVIRDQPCPQAVTLFDGQHENPELIWNGAMRARLRSELRVVMDAYMENGGGQLFQPPSPSWRLNYPELRGELRVGGVYVRLFLKNPQYQLKDPVKFLEHLCTEAIRLAEYALPKSAGGSGREGAPPPIPGGSSTALVVAEDDLLSILVSAAVYVLRVRPGLVERSIQWGHIARTASLLRGANEAGVGVGAGPALALLRLIHQFVDSPSAVNAAAAVPHANLLLELRRCIDRTAPAYPDDVAFILDAMQRIVRSNCRPQALHALLSPALGAGLVAWLLKILADDAGELQRVREPDAARVHIVSMLKSLATHPDLGEAISRELAESPGWDRYREQRHELFLTSENKVDYFLTDDSDRVGQLLLTANGEQEQEQVPLSNGSAAPPTERHASDGAADPARVPLRAAPAAPAGSGPAPAQQPGPARVLLTTTIAKGSGGFGMDLAVVGGRLEIRQFADQPENPALLAVPRLQVGDRIERIMGEPYAQAKDAVAMIRNARSELVLEVSRAAPSTASGASAVE